MFLSAGDVARECGRIAGDDGDSRRRQARQIRDDDLAEARARRIGQNEIGSFVELRQIIFDARVLGP